jgi:signal transduction histidine kinase/ActR/RegA family two-component response regulator
MDAPVLSDVISSGGITPCICTDFDELAAEVSQGAGAVLIAEEALTGLTSQELARMLANQPVWSDLPVLLISVPSGRGPARPTGDRLGYDNVVLLERPLRGATLLSALSAALRARRRQYQIRDHLLALDRQREELRLLNETLEERVRDRTRELEEAHRRREEAEQALRQAQKLEAVGQLTGGIAHDFNNILMVISGGLDMLERAIDPARREKLMGGMRQAASRGQSLTRQLLAFARKMTLVPEPVDLRSLIDGMRILVDGALRDDIVVDIDLEDGLWPLLADPTQLELALLNLAVNARDAMPEGGLLRIEAGNIRLEGGDGGSRPGDYVRIVVSDTGQGMPAEVVEKVFEPFFTTKPVGKGTGLGLSQVYGFVTQSGGDAAIESQVGKGTSVILRLPRAEGMRTTETRAETASPEIVPSGGRAILLVEDNDQVASITRDMLESLGCKVDRAASGREALAKLQDGASFDIVFSDIVMPEGMSGIDLADVLRRRHPGLPVLLTTGYSDSIPDPQRDSVHFISKPYRLQDLERALREVAGAQAAADGAPELTQIGVSGDDRIHDSPCDV